MDIKSNTPKLPEELDKLINGVVARIEQQKGKREEGATKAVMILKHEIAQKLSI